ncbi:hypothetical protein PINS_up022393 [Pythium insidiosum]|nr:hypothetical protein PINS_up022393 [Pythium insidiosum]
MHLEMYNVTVANWPDDIRLSWDKHPKLTYLYLVRVRNITQLPDALLTFQFPIIHFTLCDSDLETLPNDLPKYWQLPFEYIIIEQSNLTSIPPSFGELHIARLSLSVNPGITSLPPRIFDQHQFISLSLSANPMLRDFPINSVSDWTTQEFYLWHTNISHLPAWVLSGAAQQTMTIFAAGSPLCVDRSLTYLGRHEFSAGLP